MEVFAPAVTEPLLSRSRPRVLVLDHLNHRTKLRRGTRRISGGQGNPVVLAAGGTNPGEPFQLVALGAAAVPTRREWELFLRSLEGPP